MPCSLHNCLTEQNCSTEGVISNVLCKCKHLLQVYEQATACSQGKSRSKCHVIVTGSRKIATRFKRFESTSSHCLRFVSSKDSNERRPLTYGCYGRNVKAICDIVSQHVLILSGLHVAERERCAFTGRGPAEVQMHAEMTHALRMHC